MQGSIPIGPSSPLCSIHLRGTQAPRATSARRRNSGFTLNVIRADMDRAGWSPSVQLFEAAACGVPAISDPWRGLEAFFEPGRASMNEMGGTFRRGARILVAGGAGFISSHRCEALAARGCRVFCVDSFLTGAPENLADQGRGSWAWVSARADMWWRGRARARRRRRPANSASRCCPTTSGWRSCHEDGRTGR